MCNGVVYSTKLTTQKTQNKFYYIVYSSYISILYLSAIKVNLNQKFKACIAVGEIINLSVYNI